MGSDNGSLPDQRQAIICTNGGILLIGTIGRNFSEIWIKMQQSSYEKMNMNRLQNGGHFVLTPIC